MASLQSSTSSKRKRPIFSDDSGNESEDLLPATKRLNPSVDVQSFIRPPSNAWSRTPVFGSQHAAERINGFNGFGITTPPAQQPRPTSEASSPSRDQGSVESEGSGSPDSGPMSNAPPIHHMFDITGRVRPPPRPTHSEDEDEDEEEEEEEEEEDMRKEGIEPAPFREEEHVRTENASDDNDCRLDIVPSPPLAAIRAPPPSPANPSFQGQDGQKMSISNLMSPPDPTSGGPIQRSPVVNQPVTSRLEAVTILIEDKRNDLEGDEPEMVEVIVQVTSGPPGTDYVTADCEELVDRLQEGPSRIDGLAKVFCLRTLPEGNKVLRQCILRLEPQATVAKGIIRVPQSLELKIVLEKLPLRVDTPGEVVLEPRADGRVPIPPLPRGKREPRASLVSGLEEIRAGTVRYQHPEAHWPQPKNGGEYYAEVVATRKPPPAPAVDQQSDRAAKSKRAMADYIRPLIQADPFWPTFHESKGHVKSNQEAVKCLQFFQDLVNKYINNHHTIPNHIPHAGGKRLTKAALLEAVGRGTTWSSDCHIVLELIKRFGPGGPDEKTEVVELLQSTSTKGGLTEFVAKMKRIKAEHDKSVGKQ